MKLRLNKRSGFTLIEIMLVVAIIAGFYPAHRAASLNPVEALRYE